MTRRRQVQRNQVLVEWTAALVGVFWGVWWGFLMQGVLEAKEELILWGLCVSKDFILLASVFLVGFHILNTVRWMWVIHKLDPDTSAREWASASRLLLLSISPIIGVIIVFVHFFELKKAQIWYGISLTLAWPTVTVVQVWLSDEFA